LIIMAVTCCTKAGAAAGTTSGISSVLVTAAGTGTSKRLASVSSTAA
jgi:hypothetical protein